MYLASCFAKSFACFLAKACTAKLGWDERVSETLAEEWRQWVKGLEGLADIRVPRHYVGLKRTSEVEWHAFCDVSDTGYGACCYVKVVQPNGVSDISLVFGKAKVAPLKALTTPRMELQGAVLATQVVITVLREFGIQPIRTKYWTDSMIVLGYLNNTMKKFHTYVKNRVERIMSVSPPMDWGHVPTQCNPPDIASRGVHGNALSGTNWFTGPEFLRRNDEHSSVDVQEVVLPEVRSVLATSIPVVWQGCPLGRA